MFLFSDFDTAMVATSGVDTSCYGGGGAAGTFPFVAPEATLQPRYNPFPADIWSMAIVFLEADLLIHRNL